MEALSSPASVGSWEPVLSGAEGERALEWAVRLAEGLRWALAPSAGASLAGGAAGLAVLFAFLARTFGEPRYDESVCRYLGLAAASSTAALPCSVSLYRGITGVAWAESLIGRLNGTPALACEDVDALACEVLDVSRPGPWGLARGLVGVGVYALERAATDARLLSLVLERLTWARDRPRRGWSGDLGMADGLSGLVAFAALVTAAGREHGLLVDAMGMMLAHTPELGPIVPAWCGGEIGAAASLALAGPFLGHPLVPQTLTRILERIPMDPSASGIDALGICHGAAGVTHVLHRLSVATGRSRVWEATAVWAQSLLERLERGERCPEPGLLEGTAGVVLVLLSLASDLEPAWDRMLLLA